METHEQDVGRFAARFDPLPYKIKINSIANIISRAHRFTTLNEDLTQTIIEILAESILLDFQPRDFPCILRTAANMLMQTDPCDALLTICKNLDLLFAQRSLS